MDNLISEFEESHYFLKNDTGFKRVSGFKYILAFLWFASNEAGGDFADRFDLSPSTLRDIIHRVTRFLSNLSAAVIDWPFQEECREIAIEFHDMGFPDVIGCIDGTHIKIDATTEDPDSYINRKKYHSEIVP